jgi:acyl-CoA synthetase (AMP-forming)/AMP-acid ligase II
MAAMVADSAHRLNVADRLALRAAADPHRVAVAAAGKRGGYATCSFAELDADATAIAGGLAAMGVQPRTRLALLVKPGVEFVQLVFGLLRSGATTILVDPGMGREHLVNCLAAAEPEGFVAVSAAQAVRVALRDRFPKAQHNVTVGRRWFWGGPTLGQLLREQRQEPFSAPTRPGDPAAIIFTSGSTGPPKGVLYTHEMFDVQAAEIGRRYDLRPGGADLACFALFGLFNAATGVTTVFPDMDFSRPAAADPRKLLRAANDWSVTQAFASPTVWDKLGRHCKVRGERIPTLRKVFSCGAPVRAEVIERTLKHVCTDPAAEMHTPYGATEALPVATIESREILGETAPRTARGAGVCVGRKFDSIEWRVIRISDEPIASLDDAVEMPPGEIGELIVRGPQVSPAYVVETKSSHGAGRLSDQIAGAKIADGDAVWHRMGDVGCLDEAGRFWYCGRKSQRVETPRGTLYTECVENVFNEHDWVRRCALVGGGMRGDQTPILVYEPRRDDRTIRCEQGGPQSPAAIARIAGELAEIASRDPALASITHFLPHASLPVDVRHNAKINREALAAWAQGQLK